MSAYLPDPDAAPWNAEDRELFQRHGINPEEAQRQLQLLRNPPPPARLERPAVPDDGVLRIPSGDEERLLACFDEAAASGRVTKLVPASGAATRMFRRLTPYLSRPAEAHRDTISARAAEGEPEASDVLELCQRIGRFAFHNDLDTALASTGDDLATTLEAGDYGRVLRALLSAHPDLGNSAEAAETDDADGAEAPGLDYLHRPKGLIPFHRDPNGARNAFEEHFHEAVAYARDDDGLCRLHFTVAPEHQERFQRHGESIAAHLGKEGGTRFEISFSVQNPATDTVALDEHGEPFRNREGALLLRPGGHGALIGNLERLLGDIVFIKNIDNVVPDHRKPPTLRWKRILGGFLAELQGRAFQLLRALDDPRRPAEKALDEAVTFLVERLHIRREDIPRGMDRAGWIFSRLHRPLRICGVVLNRGEPGGGPFWVKNPEGETSLQIVESSQIDSSDPHQRRIIASSTHFNPVDLVCGVRDFRGHPFQLSRFVDPRTAFVASKSFRSRPLKALEHPGLWNGAMAYWNTLFVEVPAETFAPVKTVFDLLRPEHQSPD